MINKNLKFVFLSMMIADCIAVIIFCIYMLIRILNSNHSAFDASLIHHTQPEYIFSCIGISAICTALLFGLGFYVRKGKIWADILIFLCILITLVLIYYLNDFIHLTEKRFTPKSKYYKLFLGFGAITILADLMGLAGIFIGFFSKKESPGKIAGQKIK